LTSSRVDADGQNELISLEQIAKFKSDAGASKINRRNLSREVLISGDVEGRSSGQVIKDIKTQIAEIKLPVGYKIVSAGEDEDITESAGYAAQALILAVIFIYLIMASQFNSFIQPFAIMFTLPLALIGVFITLFLTKDTLNLLSMIGVITLMGLVTKNGILLVDFANQRRKESNLDLRQALAEAGEIRLRPIVMTSLAAALGILPLALGLGAGSELRAPMARAIIGGLVTSTILTLFIIPIVYTFLEDVWSFICKKLNIGMKI
jgi:HAE1 family hydrophobic/amphiphilic exporter-1